MKVFRKLFAAILACTFVMAGINYREILIPVTTFAETDFTQQLEQDKQSPVIYEATWEQYTFDKGLLPYLGKTSVKCPYVYDIKLIARKNGNIHIDVVINYALHGSFRPDNGTVSAPALLIDIPSTVACLGDYGANGRSIMCGTFVNPSQNDYFGGDYYYSGTQDVDSKDGIISVDYRLGEWWSTNSREYECMPAIMRYKNSNKYISYLETGDLPVIQLDFYVKERYLTEDLTISFTNDVVISDPRIPVDPEHTDVLIPFGSSEKVTDKDTYIEELENKVTELENKITELESNPITPYKPGDINGDGIIDATDASSILCYYAYVMTGGDGNLSILDFVENEDEYMAANATPTTTTVPTTTTTQTTTTTTTTPSMDIGGSKSNYENEFSSNNTGSIRNQFDKKPMG